MSEEIVLVFEHKQGLSFYPTTKSWWDQIWRFICDQNMMTFNFNGGEIGPLWKELQVINDPDKVHAFKLIYKDSYSGIFTTLFNKCRELGFVEKSNKDDTTIAAISALEQIAISRPEFRKQILNILIGHIAGKSSETILEEFNASCSSTTFSSTTTDPSN